MSDLDPTEETVDAAIEAAAAEADVGRDDLLKRAVVALAEEEGIDVPDSEEVAALESRLDALDADVAEKVEDLRERFIDLYRDLESTAPADHTHPEVAEQLDALGEELGRVAARIDDLESDPTARTDVETAVEEHVGGLESRLAAIESRLDALDDLAARVDEMDVEDVDDKLSRVASAVVRIRRRLDAAERDRADRERLDALSATANRNGIRKAACSDCASTVDVGLLTEPACPHCGGAFAELEPNPGFLGTSRLVVGDQVALEGDVDEAAGGVSTRDAGGDR